MSKFIAMLAAIEIDSTNKVIKIKEGGITYTATLAENTYYLRGDGASDDICAAVGTALSNAAFAGNNYSVTVTTNGTTVSWDTNPANVAAKVRIALSAGSTIFQILWNDAATTFPIAALGFATQKAAEDTNAEVSTLTPSCAWVANEYHKDIVPTTRWDIGSTLLASGDTSIVRRSDKMQAKEILFQWLDGRRVWMHENTSDPTATLEKFIDTHNDGRPIEIHEQSLLSTSVTTLSALSSSTKLGTTWRLGEGGGDVFAPQRTTLGLSLWDLDLALVGAV